MYPRNPSAFICCGLNAAAALRQSVFTDFPVTALQFLDFDQSEDAHGTVGWDAMASPTPTHNAALLAEVGHLLDRLHTRHDPPGPLDEGHAWDCDLQVQFEDGTPVAWHWHERRVRWPWPEHMPPNTRLTLSLSLTGGPEFTHTLEQEITPA